VIAIAQRLRYRCSLFPYPPPDNPDRGQENRQKNRRQGALRDAEQKVQILLEKSGQAELADFDDDA